MTEEVILAYLRSLESTCASVKSIQCDKVAHDRLETLFVNGLPEKLLPYRPAKEFLPEHVYGIPVQITLTIPYAQMWILGHTERNKPLQVIGRIDMRTPEEIDNSGNNHVE
jgi:hypothetical protein